MKVFIAIKFDKREVGTCIDLTESIASVLILRGLVSETEPIANVETIDEVIAPIKETEPIANVETKQRKKRVKNN
jgi:hypothetical protein